MNDALLDRRTIRQSEDVLVDLLVNSAPDHGAPLIAGTFARAYVDLNREPYELDQDMFQDKLPAYACVRTARVAAGLGSIARVVAEGQEIYGKKLFFEEARRRIEAVHRPYHVALSGLLAEASAQHGYAVLLDWHSMPSVATSVTGGPDVVLGDRFGSSCAVRLTNRVETLFAAAGYRVSRNAPYAGGFTTEFYGRPAKGVHALQIELNRRLYVDEASFEPTSGFGQLEADVNSVLRELAREDLTDLTPPLRSDKPRSRG